LVPPQSDPVALRLLLNANRRPHLRQQMEMEKQQRHQGLPLNTTTGTLKLDGAGKITALNHLQRTC